MKKTVSILALLLIVIGGAVLLYQSYRYPKLAMIPTERVEYKPQSESWSYHLSTPIEMNFPDTPESLKGTSFTVQQYQPGLIEQRKYPDTTKEIPHKYPEDAMWVASSAYNCGVLNKNVQYIDCMDSWIDSINKNIRDKETMSLEELNKIDVYYRYLYRVNFNYKEHNICCIIQDSIIQKDSAHFEYSIIVYDFFIETPDGWNNFDESWLDREQINLVRQKSTLVAIMERLPFHNAEINHYKKMFELP